jgi:DNA-binding MarR family transcriptional regulator
VGDVELAARLRIVVTRLARRLRQEAESGATPSQLAALATIDRMGPLTLKELAAHERVQPPTMTRIVTRLEEEGLVVREVDSSDRRVARVRVSPEGGRALHRSRTRKAAFLARRLSSFRPDEREALEEALDLLERIMEAGE